MGKDWYHGCWLSQEWRLNHLYYVLSKEHGLVRFKMNWAQEALFKGMHTRNTILKARQLGMSTFTSILILDSCLHHSHFKAGIIDKGLEDAKEKLKKIKLAYQTLKDPPLNAEYDPVEDPDDRQQIANYSKTLVSRFEHDPEFKTEPLTETMVFANQSEVRIGTSLRGGTLQFLHVSEFGWVAHNNPLKAQEIQSGGFEAVPKNGCVIIESTHEGAKAGANYRIIKGAMDNVGKKLTSEDYKFFFFSWYNQPEYRIESDEPLRESPDDQYFRTLEKQGIYLDDAQKRWYTSKHNVLEHRMKTEYPTMPEEALTAETDGAIYAKYIIRLREAGYMAIEGEADPMKPLYVSWDIGIADYKSIWLIQPQANGKFLALDYFAGSDKDLAFMLDVCKSWEREHGQLISMHLLPHDAAQRDKASSLSFISHFYAAKLPAVIVPKTSDVWVGIQQVRQILPHFYFHVRCSRELVVDGKEIVGGVDSLETYRKTTVGANGVLRDMPVHDASSHGADAFRTFAEALACGLVSKDGSLQRQTVSKPKEKWAREKSKTKGVPGYW